MYYELKRNKGEHPKQKATSKSAKSSAGNKRISFFINLAVFTKIPSIKYKYSGTALPGLNASNKVPGPGVFPVPGSLWVKNILLLKKIFDVIIKNKECFY